MHLALIQAQKQQIFAAFILAYIVGAFYSLSSEPDLVLVAA